MATSKENFSKKILEVNGVKSFILVRKNGEILTHNFEDENPETISSILLFTSINCEKIKAGFGFRNLRYLSVSKENNENLFFFPMDKYFLGVMQHSTADSFDLLRELGSFINAVMSTKDVID